MSITQKLRQEIYKEGAIYTKLVWIKYWKKQNKIDGSVLQNERLTKKIYRLQMKEESQREQTKGVTAVAKECEVGTWNQREGPEGPDNMERPH